MKINERMADPTVSVFTKMDLMRLALSIGFLAIIYFAVSGTLGQSLPVGQNSVFLILAAVVGGYMAMNIGANDVANNVGPAVGSKAMTLAFAIGLAFIFEAAGALIAGGDVVKTIKKGIIDPALIGDTNTFIWAMFAALLAAAVWLNVATYVGAPVSTTHSIVGGVLGAGIAAGGWAIADWGVVRSIVASWVISPVLGGLIAAGLLYAIKRLVLYQTDKISAAKRYVPILLGLMGLAFTAYLVMKGLKKLLKAYDIPVDLTAGLLAGLVAAILVYSITRPIIGRAAKKMENTDVAVDRLFLYPLIVSAAFLSFAHGANDVANAIGPLAAINEAVMGGAVAAKAAIPLWVMVIGALGIAVGLALYGPKLIKTVGTEITELDMARAFCVAMAAAVTVIIASHLGLPVSSTHIAVGGIFGVGFLGEMLNANYDRKIEKIRLHMADVEDQASVEEFIAKFDEADVVEKRKILQELKTQSLQGKMPWDKRKRFKKAYREKLVQRSLLYKIVLAWIVTVPVSALLSAAVFFMLRGIMMP